MRKGLGSLPQDVTSFVGRREELADAKRLLSGSRLVTLVGVGGVGKTRLALRVAAALRRGFRDGVWLVELDRVDDEALLAPSVAEVLGVRSSEPPLTALADYLADRQLLLVLDTCEHLLSPVAKLADALLRSAGGLRILVTSRQPLGIDGEAVLPVPPLATPPATPPQARPPRRGKPPDPTRHAAVALFLERAAAVVPAFELTEANQDAVAEICRRLDGLPLAIELAAARLPALSSGQIRDRLADRLDLLSRGSRTAPPRQQALRLSIEWSYDLCTPVEQLLWARLSVFAGEFDLDAAEGVCADEELPSADILELVSSLVDKSVIAPQPDRDTPLRYRMLDSVRAHGQEKLRARGEETRMRRLHRDWYRRQILQAEAEWLSSRQVDWLVRLDRELPDIRRALGFCLTEEDDAPPDRTGPDDTTPDETRGEHPARDRFGTQAGAAAALTMAAAMLMHWTARGLHAEGRHWLGLALARPGPPTPERVKALFVDTALAAAPGDVAAAAVPAREAREVAVRCGDPFSLALATFAEASLATGSGDLATGLRHTEEALSALSFSTSVESPPLWGMGDW
jgi:non-specific serine/threonine protein kinase